MNKTHATIGSIISNQSNLINNAIDIVSTDAVINNQELQLNVDENKKVCQFSEMLAETYQLGQTVKWGETEFRVDDSLFWMTPNTEKERLFSFADQNYIRYNDSAIIDGFVTDKSAMLYQLREVLYRLKIDRTFDSHGDLEINGNLLKELTATEAYQNSEAKLPPLATARVNIYPSFMLYLNRRFPELDIHDESYYIDTNEEREGHPLDKFCLMQKMFYVERGFFTEHIEEELHERFGVHRHSLEIIYRVEDEVAERYNDSHLTPLCRCGDKLYSITRPIGKTDYDEVNTTYNAMRYTIFQRLGRENVEMVSVRCHYKYHFNLEYHTLIDEAEARDFYASVDRLPDYCSLSEDGMHLNIRLDWNSESLLDIANELRKSNPEIDMLFYKNHKYKFDSTYYIQDLIAGLQDLALDIEIQYCPILNAYYFYSAYRDTLSMIVKGDDFKERMAELAQNSDRYSVTLRDADADTCNVRFDFDRSTYNDDMHLYLASHFNSICRIDGVAIGTLSDISEYPRLTVELFDNKRQYAEELVADGAITQITLDY